MMNARQLRQLLPVLHAFAYRGVVEYKPLDGDTWTRINPDTTEFRPELMNPQEWRWKPIMPDDHEFMADYTEAELKSRIEELEQKYKECDELRRKDRHRIALLEKESTQRGAMISKEEHDAWQNMVDENVRLRDKAQSCFARVAELERRLDEATEKINNEIQEVKYLERIATQRGERMQIMRKWIGSAGDGDNWDDFLVAYPEAADWFDEDGVPVREGE